MDQEGRTPGKRREDAFQQPTSRIRNHQGIPSPRDSTTTGTSNVLTIIQPAMPAKKKAALATRKSARVSAADEANRQQDEKEKENQKLKEQVAALKTRLELANGSGGGQTTSNLTAMSREVAKTAKKKLWKRCKFIIGEKTLRKGCKYVISQLDLAEFQGLDEEAYKVEEERFIAEHKNSVRLAINKQRNYVQQELRDFMMNELKEGRGDDYPTVEEMEQLVLRNMLDDKTEEEVLQQYEAKFEKYWNLLAKVANHSSWNPFKRHFFLISSDGWIDEPGPNDTYVTASDEAFLLTIWKNCFNKWKYKSTQKANNLEVDEDDPAMVTPFTNAKSGQKKFGGWKEAGIRILLQLGHVVSFGFCLARCRRRRRRRRLRVG